MQRMGGGAWNKKTRKVRRGGGNDPSCGCDMQAGWPKFLTENIPLPSVGPSVGPSQKGGASCGIPPIPNYYQGGGSMVTTGQRGGGCACAGLPLPTPLQQGGGQPTYYNSNPVPDACPFPGTGYCGFYARGGANYGEPMYLQAKLRGGSQSPRSRPQAPSITLLREAARQLREEGRPARITNIALRARQIRESSQGQAQGAPAVTAPVDAPVVAAPKKNLNNMNTTNGGGCGCGLRRGGYRPTKKNLKALKKWRKGESIGFTMTSSLKAKGLIPRTSRKNRGKKVVSAKYK